MTLRLAVAQIAASTEPDANLALVREQAGRAAAQGAELVVFPEATMASFATRSAAVAEPLDGPFATGVRAVASELGVTLAVGLFTPGRPRVGDDGTPRVRARNTLLVTGPGVEASYDKIHLFDALGFTESRHVEAGSDAVVVDVAGVRIGLSICFDVRFPELFKHLAGRGAEVILVPASWANGPGKAKQWEALVRARALDSTCFVVGAGQADPMTVGQKVEPGAPTGVGHSLVVGPNGDVLARADAAPELLVVDLEPADVARARESLPVLAGARFMIRPPHAPEP